MKNKIILTCYCCSLITLLGCTNTRSDKHVAFTKDQQLKLFKQSTKPLQKVSLKQPVKQLAEQQQKSPDDKPVKKQIAVKKQDNKQKKNKSIKLDSPVKYKYSYRVRGKHYQVLDNGKNFTQIGTASWYGKAFHKKKTANGERYNMYALTAAHKTLPLGSKVEVTNLVNGRKLVLRINDRGPFHGDRVIDVSKKAAQKLGFIKFGKTRVKIKVIK